MASEKVLSPKKLSPRSLTLLQRVVVAFLRCIPARTRGKKRLARLLFRPADGPTVIKLSDGSTLLVPDACESVAFDCIVDGQYEPETLELILRWMRDGKSGAFVDIGANIGAIAIPLARRLGDQTPVLAVEGSPHIAEFLRYSLDRNQLKNITLENVLCGESATDVEFFHAPDSKSGMGSRGAQFSNKPDLLPMRTLDQIAASVRPIRAIKIDVEGFEHQVFSGATQILKEDRPPIVFEFVDWAEARNTTVQVGDAQRRLMQYGYQIWTQQAYETGGPALKEPITSGTFMLVAIHPQA